MKHIFVVLMRASAERKSGMLTALKRSVLYADIATWGRSNKVRTRYSVYAGGARTATQTLGSHLSSCYTGYRPSRAQILEIPTIPTGQWVTRSCDGASTWYSRIGDDQICNQAYHIVSYKLTQVHSNSVPICRHQAYKMSTRRDD